MKKTATNQDIAATLEVTPKTVCGYVAAGLPHRKKGGAYLFDPGEVADWMEARRPTGKLGNPDRVSPDDGGDDEDTLTFWRREKEEEHVLKLRQKCAVMDGELNALVDVEAANVKKIHAVKESLFAGVV